MHCSFILPFFSPQTCTSEMILALSASPFRISETVGSASTILSDKTGDPQRFLAGSFPSGAPDSGRMGGRDLDALYLCAFNSQCLLDTHTHTRTTPCRFLEPPLHTQPVTISSQQTSHGITRPPKGSNGGARLSHRRRSPQDTLGSVAADNRMIDDVHPASSLIWL